MTKIFTIFSILLVANEDYLVRVNSFYTEEAAKEAKNEINKKDPSSLGKLIILEEDNEYILF